MDHIPARLPPIPSAVTSSSVPAGFIEGVWHPEDLVGLAGTRWIVVSAMRSMQGKGALLAVSDDGHISPMEIAWAPQAERGRVSAGVFDPHGIDARPMGKGRFELLVVEHGGGEAIGRLTIDTVTGQPVIVACRRIDQPAGTSGNAVAFLSDGGFLVTSMFDPHDPDTLDKFSRGAVTGSVWRWGEVDGWRPLGRMLSGANGIAVSADGHTVYVSEWSARRVWKLAIDGTELGHVDVNFLPDNLRWTPQGDLLLAGQAARPEHVFGCEARGEPCPLAFAVVRLDPATMQITRLLDVSHERAQQIGFGGATGALSVGDEIWVGSFTSTRLARYLANP